MPKLTNDLTQAEPLSFTPEFLSAYNLMEHTADHLFITGSAGTGKSTLLSYFRENTAKNVVVLAPTGIAALNAGGQTIHSFFKFPLGVVTAKSITESPRKEFYQAIDTIVIDEVSMVRADIIDGIDSFMRINGRNKKKPFGGVQMIFIGDLFQLPPVLSGDDEKSLFMSLYETPYFFSASVFGKVQLRTLQLRQIFRQSDAAFIELLQAIRTNCVEPSHLERLNMRVKPEFLPSEEDFFITLTTTNERASEMNIKCLSMLKAEPKQLMGTIEGIFDRKALPTEETLTLKKGAQVMFVRNDPYKRWVNGTIGKVREILPDAVKVEIERNGVRKVVTAERVEWQMLKYDFDAKTKEIFSEPIGAFTQFPLRLAWAVTIHKSQGKTFDKVVIDLGRGTFAHGQLYVALSRCRSLEGIVLRRPVRSDDVKVDLRIVDFMRQLSSSS
ncbi:MAG: DEAD/DEAH box helicase [Chloroherpetonaceae bacterium]|nr:DEAD/DEAH box helicase [Chloroherpetonaceae bacterium]MDW8465663.1 DEAD/DEAH box helicase [Chloroherpetonaceae bacterium]